MAHRRKKLAAGAIAILAGGAALFVVLAPPSYTPWTLNPADARVTLEDVEREVSRRYPVADITASKLSRMIAANEAVLFDVRTPAEYDAGHLPGAIRVEPGTTPDAFAKLHADKLGGKPIVFYCAVGV
ncbi:MAG: rhodanese-like domain-containing protein, partial [Hyphomicrobiaceae bacterium]|nr:rhodanese-like domain-containing protein [Hyphomicrobiaceae bacterium]